MRVLIAEDDPVTRRLLESRLTRWGYEVETCVGGTEALECLQREDRPGLALLDWMMPGMSGLDVCRAVRSQDKKPYTYLILLTAKSDHKDIVQGLEAGADDYIVKPFVVDELKVRVRAGARIQQLQEDLISALRACEFQASHDALTRVWNRGAILDVLGRELARSGRNGSPLALIMADVDHFKRVNDLHGHLAGDAVLRELPQRMLSALRPYDSVGRYGGEEFLIVLPDCSMFAAGNTAERIRANVAERDFTSSEGRLRVTMSLGVTATRPGLSLDAEDLIREADEALYAAKSAGRNRVELEGMPPHWYRPPVQGWNVPASMVEGLIGTEM